MAAPASALRTARAWLLDVGGGYRVAAGAHHVAEYLLAPETMAVPRTPVYCPGVLLWRDRLIPVVDLAPLLPARAVSAAGWRHAVVLAWQDAPGEPLRHGALVVRAAPFEAFIADDMACALPQEAPVFGQIGSSCFSYEERPVPVLDVARLFGRPLPHSLLRNDEEVEEALHVAEVALAVPGETPAPGAACAEGRFRPDAGEAMSPDASASKAHEAPGMSLIETAETDASAACALTPSVSDPPLQSCVEESKEPVDPTAVDEDHAAALREPMPGESPPHDAVEQSKPVSPGAPQPGAVARPGVRADRAGSKFGDSLARFQALERRHTPARRYRWLPWAGLIVVAALGLLMAVTWQANPHEASSATGATPPGTAAVRDVAPTRLELTSAPTPPAQPPN